MSSGPIGQEAVALSTCMAFINGWLGGYIGGINASKGKLEICMARGVSNQQIAQVFVDWAKKNPAKKLISSSLNLHIALKEAFPCP
jgi:Rap1a immunity proteins